MELIDVWKSTLLKIQPEVSQGQFESYLKKLGLLEIEPQADGSFLCRIGCPSAFHQMEVSRRFKSTIEQALTQELGQESKVELRIAEIEPLSDFETTPSKPEQIEVPVPKIEQRTIPERVHENSPMQYLSQESTQKEEIFKEKLLQFGLKPELTLEKYAVSTSNEMAFAAAQAVAQMPGAAYNPLFIYGDVGVGKTHLMQGVGQEILKNNLRAKIIYCSGEEFTNEIIAAIQNKSTPLFRKRYRNVQLLLIDDIQFIAGKKSVQEEFFHTFNAITKEGGQVIMTSDKPPKEIDSLEDRLRSRFEGGLTIDIGNPDFELRSAIVLIKAQQMSVEIEPSVAQYIASLAEGTRPLLGKLTMLITMAKVKNQAITTELAEQVFKPQFENDNNSLIKQRLSREVRPIEVIKEVCKQFQVQLDEVLGKSRKQHLALPRHVAMFILKTELQLSLVDIGRQFGGKDHTSVMHAVGKISKAIPTQHELSEKIDKIKSALR